MASKNFLLVSLDESKAKQLAQIVSNDICRKILDYLAARDKHATETEVAKDLGIPLSTVHYNLKQLLQSSIVKAEEFHYSEKGREVNHYSLANKYIIIAPKATATESLANKLKKILPVVGVVAATGAAIQLFSMIRGATFSTFGTRYYAVQKAAEAGIPQAVPEAAQQVVEQVVEKGAEAVMPQAAQRLIADAVSSAASAPALISQNASQAAQTIGNGTSTVVIEKVITETVHTQPNIVLWFAIGALFALVVYLIYDVIRERSRQQ